ncbi:hypothetical protein BS47DRAFT_1399451 [Hydnum rufescens UP504]|uniref:Fungal-type protein kinase domain-containing protein n=1 Tax=Hydnum rufescens UP504 TaxID=1448309 RepID=A0A9P6AIS9_9AGAM|nr:hypothetical protein BS47DRAFT_1399451 [Hydnum rufescens UP504]
MSAAFSVTDLALFGRVMFPWALSPLASGASMILSVMTLLRTSGRCPPGPVIQNVNEEACLSSLVTLKEIVYWQYALIGRGTCVIRGEVKEDSDLSGKDLTVKICWPSRWRTSEVDFLEAAHTYALSQNDEHILGHIPQAFLHQDFYSTADGPRGKCAFENDDHRVLPVIVMDSYLPMSQLHTASDFTQVIIDVIKCHRALHEGPKILHWDISMNNIMFCRGENNRCGSFHLDRRFRTGTLPFMAIDLLAGKDKIHWVRHDLESILWVTVWYTARYHEGIETTRAFQVWRKADMFTLAEKKVYFLNTTDLYEPTAHFNTVAVWVGLLLDLFCHARGARTALSFRYRKDRTSETLDPETLGGRITYETFLHILEEE